MGGKSVINEAKCCSPAHCYVAHVFNFTPTLHSMTINRKETKANSFFCEFSLRIYKISGGT